MKVTKIYDVDDMDHDDIVKAIKGRVTKIFPYRDDDPDDGKPWSLQTVVLVDGDDEIKATFKDRMEEIPKSWKGRMLYLESQNAGGRWTGVKVKDDDYKSKGKHIEERILWITPSASVGFDDDEEDDRSSRSRKSRRGQSGRSERRSESRSGSRRSKRRADPPSDDEEPPTRSRRRKKDRDDDDGAKDPMDSYVETKVKLSKIANLWLITAEAANYCREAYKERTGEDMTDAMYDSCLGQMFAEAKSCGMVAMVPMVDMRAELLPDHDGHEHDDDEITDDDDRDDDHEEENEFEGEDED